MTKKQILETDFKPEMAINDIWDVIVIGSGTVSFFKCLFSFARILSNYKKVVLVWLQQT